MESAVAECGAKKRRIHCGHCGEMLSKSAYYRHRSQFYDTTKRMWMSGSELSLQSTRSESDDEPITWDDERVPMAMSENSSDSEQLQEMLENYSSEQEIDSKIIRAAHSVIWHLEIARTIAYS